MFGVKNMNTWCSAFMSQLVNFDFSLRADTHTHTPHTHTRAVKLCHGWSLCSSELSLCSADIFWNFACCSRRQGFRVGWVRANLTPAEQNKLPNIVTTRAIAQLGFETPTETSIFFDCMILFLSWYRILFSQWILSRFSSRRLGNDSKVI